MTQAEPAGLMAFWADIGPDYETRFLEWHNCEHMPERVSVPRFPGGPALSRARRLVSLPDDVLHENADVLGSRAYMERLNDPTPWTRESLGHFRNPSRNVYTMLAEHGRTSLREFPYLVSVRFDIAPDAVARTDRRSRAGSCRDWPPCPPWAGCGSTASTPPSPASRPPNGASMQADPDRSAFCSWPNAAAGCRGDR